jgi:glycosyltransferase involved in cell wall biosynthesis
MSEASLGGAWPRVLIVAEHASFRFGGEAAIPAQYFKFLRRKGVDVQLVVHERTRDELRSHFPEEIERLHFVTDSAAHKLLYRIGRVLPDQLSYFTTGLLMRLLTQRAQVAIIREILRSSRVDIIHQPIPVSPKEPSVLYGLGVPVIIGPMNGGMQYPPGFSFMQSNVVRAFLGLGERLSRSINRLAPGKLRAAALLVANERTKAALPFRPTNVIELVENGVDPGIWAGDAASRPEALKGREGGPPRLVFIGRLVDWKGVRYLLEALATLHGVASAAVEIIGEGSARSALEQQAEDLRLLVNQEGSPRLQTVSVVFSGWLTQEQCAQRLHGATALVLPSLYECGGAVVLEAMAAGVPVIATRWGGPADYADEECGILVPPEDPRSFVAGLAAAIRELVDDPERAQRMGNEGRRRVLQRFSWPAKVERVLEIYQNVLGGRPNP